MPTQPSGTTTIEPLTSRVGASLGAPVASAPASSNSPRPSRWPSALTWVALAGLALGTALRVWIASRNITSPMIDENEVVEQAVAFMGDDRRFFFLKYGPLTMYVLAGIYHVAARLHGSSALDYAARVFFDGGEHYLIARLYVVGWLSILAAVAFVSFRRRVGSSSALLVLTLLAFPALDVLAAGARIDMPQAAFQGLALLALGEAVATGHLAFWLLAGACAGFAFATKPLLGLLLAPCFPAAAWLAARARPDGTLRATAARLGATFASPGMWLAAAAVAGCAVLGNPAMLELPRFVASQRDAVVLHSGDSLGPRGELGRALLELKLPFLMAVLASGVACAFVRARQALLPALFIAVYLTALYGRDVRTYFMVAPAAAGCLLIGHGAKAARELAAHLRARRNTPEATADLPEGSHSLGRRERGMTILGPLVVALVLAAWPATLAVRRAQRPSPTEEARQWIYANIPSGTRMFLVGWRPAGPQLVATDERLQASWGDHFDYGRSNYAFLKQAFHLGFERYAASGKPRYALSVHDDLPRPRSTKRMPRRVSDGLLREAQRRKLTYIILAGYSAASWRDLGYPWLSGMAPVFELGKMAIFKVPSPAPPTRTPTEREATPAPLR